MKRIAGRVVTTLVCSAAIAFVVFAVLIPRMTNGAALTVLSGSMTPAIPVGSLVLVQPQNPELIKPGDVITFQKAPGVAEYVTHRVVDVRRDTTPHSFITKGDANKGEDPEPVPFGAVRGQVRYHLPYAGTAANLVRSPLGLWGLGLVVCVIALYALGKTLAGELRSRRSSGPAAAPDARPAA